jgi:hypothetical protein
MLDDLPAVGPQTRYPPGVVNEGTSADGLPIPDHNVQPAQQAQDATLANSIQSPTFADELRTLSLAAAAERHLGSTSGLSFAKLTQTVLRRLTPDKADFVFINHQRNIAGASLFDLESPSESLGGSVFQNLSDSVSSHPVLFGDLYLADLTVSDSTELRTLAWPSDEVHVQRLVNFYFAHSHTLYPFLSRSEIAKTLERIRNSPHELDNEPAVEVFRLWMVLAIGSTGYSSITLTEESESRLYYSKALQYSELALGTDDFSALEVIMLQVSYSFFNQLGPNTWFLVGTAARLALGMGLHTASTYGTLSKDESERRKRVFFCIYMMDRVVSVALGRPFAINDDDLDIEDFSPEGHDDQNAFGDQYMPDLGQPSPLAVPLHILALRRIASKISRNVYTARASAGKTDEEREAILASLHQELLAWRRNTPFPLPNFGVNVPHLTTTWYDFNFYSHLAMIYRPSPLCPRSDVRRIKILETAASMSIRQAYSMHQQRSLAYNWLNFLALFTSTLSLVYAVTAQPEELVVVLRQTRAIQDLDLVLQLFDTFGQKFLAATKISNMIQEISRTYKSILARHDQSTATGLPELFEPAQVFGTT